MILRRVIAHFRKQEWTAIAIDFVIVVLGVFVGIQVSNWNEARKERESEEAYVRRIRADIQSDIDNLGERSRYWAQVAEAGRGAAAYAETGELVDGSAWKTVRAFYWASNLWTYWPNDTSFNDMTGAGDVTLIRNGALREGLSNYYSDSAKLVRSVVYAVVPDYRAAVRGATPVAVAFYINDRCHSLGPLNQHFIDCPAPVSEAEAADILNAYFDRPLLVDQLRFWLTNLNQLAQGAVPDLEAAKKLAAEIDRELAQ